MVIYRNQYIMVHFKLKKIIRKSYSYVSLFLFSLKKIIFGFDVANDYLKFVNKVSLQLILRKYGAKIGHNCDIESGQTFHNCQDYSNLLMGDNCHVGKNCFFDLRGQVILGNNVVISMQSTFITHIDLSMSSLSRIYPVVKKSIKVGNDSYIGANSTILKGVEIGPSSIIAASSLVNKSIGPLVIAGGVPAVIIKKIKNE